MHSFSKLFLQGVALLWGSINNSFTREMESCLAGIKLIPRSKFFFMDLYFTLQRDKLEAVQFVFTSLVCHPDGNT